MRVIAASSSSTNPAEAILRVGERLRALRFDRKKDGFALVFCTTDLARDPVALSGALKDLLGEVPYVGYVGASVFHDARLLEKKPALAVLVVEGARAAVRTASLDGSPGDVAAALLADMPHGRLRFLSVGVDAGTPGSLLDFLPDLDDARIQIAGCLSLPPSGQRPSILADGVGVGPAVALLDVDGVGALLGVAQAARQLGKPRWVTAATANLIQEVDGRPAFEALLSDLPATLRTQIPRLGGVLCAGFGTEEGDAFLMRHVVGLDPTTGAVAVAGTAKVGAEIVFSLRDQASARADLDELLSGFEESLGDRQPLAFVVFDCAARDQALFGVQNHDVQRVLSRFGTEIPVVGVAGGGELCTYGRGTYLFGMSCVVAALFE